MSECNHSEDSLIDNCPHCGAPVCCRICCELQTKDMQIATLHSQVAELEQAQRWIPVTERLPDKWGSNVEFLVAVEGLYIKKSWYSREEGWDYSDVTNWMPLPTLPQESGDE